jgi:hypothetical protein
MVASDRSPGRLERFAQSNEDYFALQSMERRSEIQERDAPSTSSGDTVKPNTLTIASLLSIILLPLHVGGDIALGLDRGGPGLVFVVLPILFVVACGALLFPDRLAGYIIMFLGGLVALGMPIIHRNNGFTPTVAKAPGGLFFMWTLMALGVTGALAIVLSARGLWNLRSRKT